MLIKQLTLQDGTELINVPANEEVLTELGFDSAQIVALLAPVIEDENARLKILKIRFEIKPVAGDTQSIQGTIADNVGHLMEELGRFMAAVNTANSLEDIKTAAQPLAINLAPLITAIDANQCTLTHHVKGTAQVVEDACMRADAVATVLADNAGP